MKTTEQIQQLLSKEVRFRELAKKAGEEKGPILSHLATAEAENTKKERLKILSGQRMNRVLGSVSQSFWRGVAG